MDSEEIVEDNCQNQEDGVKGILKEDDENSEDVSIMDNDPRTY